MENSIITFQSTKEIQVSIFDPKLFASIYLDISMFQQDKIGFVVSGTYYYKELSFNESEEPTENIVFLRQFSRPFTVDEANQLYAKLGIKYPDKANYTQCRIIDLTKATKYVLTVNPVFGLSGDEWELVNYKI